MSSAFVQLPLVRMVDLAISTAEGAVNFNVLQALLHALIQKSNAQTLVVEIHGVEAAKLQEQLKTAPEKPTYTIKETVDKSKQGKDQEIYVLQPETAYTGSSSVAKEKVDSLEAEINDLKTQIVELRDLPGNLGIIEAVKNFDDKTSTVIDVFHMLSQQKRIEGLEEGMVKVASIVEDLIKSPGALSLDTKNVVCQKEDESVVDSAATSKATKKPVSLSMEDPDALLKQLVKDVEEIMIRLRMKKQRSLESLAGEGEEGEELPSDFQMSLADEKLKELAETVERIDLTLNEETTRLHNQFTDLEKDFNELLNKFEQGGGYGDADEPNTCCTALYQKLVQLETDFASVNDAAGKLLDDKAEKTKLMDVIMEQIEALKTGKADREAIEEALAEKADACTVLRKVSHDQFDNAYEELSKGVGEALDKLTNQESLWQQALEDIQSDIDNKLDKMDLAPLREFINGKLRTLQDKIKGLAELKREQEAAGTKNKLLRDVNCISCDKDVVMQKELDLSFRPVAPSYPANRSIAPYLAYELDALRRRQKAIPEGKNLISFEAALASRAQKKADDHICNRYCGGSHTITTATQRVARLGHFLNQWGPEAQPAASGDKEKRGSLQRVASAEKAPESGAASPKVVSSKGDVSKRNLRTSSQSKKMKTASEEAEGEEQPPPEPKPKLSRGSSSLRRKSSLKTKETSKGKTSKMQVETIPEVSEENEGSIEGKPEGEVAAPEPLPEGEKAPSPTPATDAQDAEDEEAESYDLPPTTPGSPPSPTPPVQEPED